MNVLANSNASLISEASQPQPSRSWRPAVELLAVFCLLAATSAGALWWCYQNGYLLHYGDAVAHLNIARRIVDSRTPGYDQIGTVWLPLPHALALPLVRHDELWRTGLAGAIPAAAAFILAGCFLFAAVRRLFSSSAAGFTAVLLLASNPNLLYLQSIPMTETVFFAAFFALAYFTVRFRERQSAWTALGAGLAVLAGTLTRYEGWFLIPFVGLYLLFAGRRRVLPVLIFLATASAGPLYWLAHNWYYYADPLEFYHGPSSAKAIYERALASGMQRYRGDGEWGNAARYFVAAVRLVSGNGLAACGVLGSVALVWKRRWWSLVLFLLPSVFYVISMYSGGTPIFVPDLWPFSYYNTRYGLAALPLLALGGAALAAAAPRRFRIAASAAVVCLALAPWLAAGSRESWVCWKESQVNSEVRRAWTQEAAEFLKAHYHGGGIIASFGDLTAIFLEAGIPLRETLHSGNSPHWPASLLRPDLFLWEEWAVTYSGDPVATAILRAQRSGPRYECVKMIALKGAPVIEIYQRHRDESSVLQGARRGQ
jgi:hypothetical protein